MSKCEKCGSDLNTAGKCKLDYAHYAEPAPLQACSPTSIMYTPGGDFNYAPSDSDIKTVFNERVLINRLKELLEEAYKYIQCNSATCWQDPTPCPPCKLGATIQKVLSCE